LKVEKRPGCYSCDKPQMGFLRETHLFFQAIPESNVSALWNSLDFCRKSRIVRCPAGRIKLDRQRFGRSFPPKPSAAALVLSIAELRGSPTGNRRHLQQIQNSLRLTEPTNHLFRLPSINQRTVRSENNRNFSTQRIVVEGGAINQTEKQTSSSAKEALSTAT
jgi:hypothetical protein